MKKFFVLVVFVVLMSTISSRGILKVSIPEMCLNVLKDTGLSLELKSRFKAHGMKIEFVLSDDPLESIEGEASAAIRCGDVPEGVDIVSSIPLLALRLSYIGDERPDFLGTTIDLVRKAKYIFPRSTIVVFKGLKDALEALREGDVDAVLDFEYSLLKSDVSEDELHGIDNVKAFLRFLFPSDHGISEEINSLILEMFVDGVIERLVKNVNGVERSNVLRLAVIEWPPYEFLDCGKWVGTDVEIVRRVLKKLGYDIEVNYYPPVRAFRLLEKGVLDGAFSLERTPDREKFLEYVDVPVSSGFDVFFTSKKPGLDRGFDPELVRGSLCGYVRGYANLEILERFCSRIITVPSDELGMMLLGKGRIGAFMTNYFVGSFFAKKLGILDKVVASDAVRRYDSYMALSKSSPHVSLVDFLRKALVDFKNSSEYNRVLQEYGITSGWNGR